MENNNIFANHFFVGIIFIIGGFIFAVFSKQLGKETSDFYFKLLKIRFSEKGYQLGFFLVGILVIIFGILAILKIIE